MIKIVLLALAIVGVIMIALYFFMLKAFDNNRDEIISEQTVIFEEINDSIYIRARAWGVSGNHNEIIISLDPIEREGRQAEKEKDYIFYATEIYYKKQGIDTLLIYADGSSIGKKPAVFTERIKIVPVKIKTADEAMKYEKNYKKYGLTKVSAYP
jgi:hypothetical protein